MPIVKQKLNLNVLQIAVEKDLRRRSCRPIMVEIHSDENSRNTSHSSVEDVYANPSKEALLFHKKNSEHLNRNVAEKEKMDSEISQNRQGTETLRTILEYREQIRNVSSKFFLMGSSSSIKTRNNPLSTEKKVKQLITLMLISQLKFSKERKKLYKAIQHLYTYIIKNEKINQQMTDATLEQYIELRAEINRNGEKCEETKKVMTASRKQFENDVAGATQVREKLCDFQNRLQFTELDVGTLKENNLIKKLNLRRLQRLKNGLRIQKDNLQQYRCTLQRLRVCEQQKI